MLIPSHTGTTADRILARIVRSSSSLVGSYEAKEARRSRYRPRVRSRRPTTQTALEALPN